MPACSTKLFTAIFFTALLATYPALSCGCVMPRPFVAFCQVDMIIEAKIVEVGQKRLESKQSLDDIAAAPDSEHAWAESGDLLAQFQQYEEAKEFFSRALEFNPASTKALIGRGAVLMMQEQYALALADFERAALFSPKDAGVIKQRDRAAKCLEKISTSDTSEQVRIMRKEAFCKPSLTD